MVHTFCLYVTTPGVWGEVTITSILDSTLTTPAGRREGMGSGRVVVSPGIWDLQHPSKDTSTKFFPAHHTPAKPDPRVAIPLGPGEPLEHYGAQIFAP